MSIPLEVGDVVVMRDDMDNRISKLFSAYIGKKGRVTSVLNPAADHVERVVDVVFDGASQQITCYADRLARVQNVFKIGDRVVVADIPLNRNSPYYSPFIGNAGTISGKNGEDYIVAVTLPDRVTPVYASTVRLKKIKQPAPESENTATTEFTPGDLLWLKDGRDMSADTGALAIYIGPAKDCSYYGEMIDVVWVSPASNQQENGSYSISRFARHVSRRHAVPYMTVLKDAFNTASTPISTDGAKDSADKLHAPSRDVPMWGGYFNGRLYGPFKDEAEARMWHDIVRESFPGQTRWIRPLTKGVVS